MRSRLLEASGSAGCGSGGSVRRRHRAGCSPCRPRSGSSREVCQALGLEPLEDPRRHPLSRPSRGASALARPCANTRAGQAGPRPTKRSSSRICATFSFARSVGRTSPACRAGLVRKSIFVRFGLSQSWMVAPILVWLHRGERGLKRWFVRSAVRAMARRAVLGG